MVIKNTIVIFVLQMVSINMSFSVRLLSWIYVNIWIPIRLAYLRMKIAMRPFTSATCEVLASLNMMMSFVPISAMMIVAETINVLAKAWLRLTCLGYEKAIGAEPESFYESCMLNRGLINFDDFSFIDEEERIDDKNSEEESIKEQPVETTEEAELLEAVD